ncbi:hypothetical protein NIES2104_56120 [Leptolyngbya sp. NIES-2104]|nr:hypothetical protein NIES2104_56120 [Leptolyngbya sp. NIES-2104]
MKRDRSNSNARSRFPLENCDRLTTSTNSFAIAFSSPTYCRFQFLSCF